MSDEPQSTAGAELSPPRPVPTPATDPDPVGALETELAAYLGLSPRSVVAAKSGADGYSILFEALALSGGEIVLPAVGADSLARGALDAGLTVVPAEVEADTANLGARGLARALSAETALVGGVHAFGHPFAAGELGRAIASRGLPLIEDASAALGAAYRQSPVGTLGAAAVFVLGREHVLSGGLGGEGALLVAGDAALAERMRAIRDARRTGLHEGVGAVALAELRGADEELAARRQLAWELTFDLRGMRALNGMAHSRWVVHGYDCYTIRLRGLLWKRSIGDTVAALNEAGVTARIALGESLHRHAEVQARLGSDERAADDALPVATRLPGELIAVPLHGGMTDASIGAIAAALKQLEQEST